MTTSARSHPPKSPVELAGYLQKILTARVYDVAIESALDPAPALSARLDNLQAAFTATGSLRGRRATGGSRDEGRDDHQHDGMPDD